MSGDFRITRGTKRRGEPPIEMSDWRRAVEITPHVRILDRAGTAIWDREAEGASYVLKFESGEIIAAPPDAAGVRTMIALAERLGAAVVGARGEAYRLRNNVLVAVGEDGSVKPVASRTLRRRKPWWRFW